MHCPFCHFEQTKVVDTREIGDGIRRRRECLKCHQRFTTYERLGTAHLQVVKRDGRREEFDREKLMSKMRLACTKREVSSEDIEQAVAEIESTLFGMGKAEVDSRIIGDLAMERLRQLDDVAYVRFASIYRQFADVDVLAEEIQALKARKQREEELKRQLPLAF